MITLNSIRNTKPTRTDGNSFTLVFFHFLTCKFFFCLLQIEQSRPYSWRPLGLRWQDQSDHFEVGHFRPSSCRCREENELEMRLHFRYLHRPPESCQVVSKYKKKLSLFVKKVLPIESDFRPYSWKIIILGSLCPLLKWTQMFGVAGS